MTCVDCGCPWSVEEAERGHSWGIGAHDYTVVMPRDPDRMWGEAGALYAEAIRGANEMRQRAWELAETQRGIARYRERMGL